MSLRRNARGTPLGAVGWAFLSLTLLLGGIPPGAAAQSPHGSASIPEATSPPNSGGTGVSAEPRPQDQNESGYITGTVIDKAGAVAVGAHVHLKFQDRPGTEMDGVSGENGQFSFSGVPPGAFQLTISAEGFETQLVPGTLEPGSFASCP